MVVYDVRPLPDLPGRVLACLLDLDGVLTRSATAHEAASREMFDELLTGRSGTSSRPFGPDDYERYLDGTPRDDLGALVRRR
jgi:beta-phosphoglucomutase-like phosphatase (HAD superfamily)